ncbi:kinase [Pseudoxanthomonas putridarboris]
MTTLPHPLENEGFPHALATSALAAARALPGGTPVFGIAGLQGSGKSTLARQIAELGQSQGLRVAVLSIDDAYLTRAQRQRLAADVHPLLATRGPPGTHDVGLACAVLDALRAGESVRLPRFDKLADDRAPEREWDRVDERLDLVIFEGWCLQVPPQDEGELATPLNALERDEDPDARWRRWCNEALVRDYPALWARLDALWFLQPPGFDIVAAWRWQQERHLHARDPGRVAMDEAQVRRFIQFFERVSRQALRTLPAVADATIALDENRKPRAWPA